MDATKWSVQDSVFLKKRTSIGVGKIRHTFCWNHFTWRCVNFRGTDSDGLERNVSMYHLVGYEGLKIIVSC